MKTTHIILALVALLVIGGLIYWMSASDHNPDSDPVPLPVDTMPVEPDGGIGDGAEPLDELLNPDAAATTEPQSVIGTSAEGTDIVAYHFGSGTKELLLVSNLHGGDAPNTEQLARALVTDFTRNENNLPDDVMVTVIPTLNPDGLADNSRFNANGVDLNRNFACDWAAKSMWRDQEVSGGDSAFSEPEAAALRDYITGRTIAAAVVWFAAEGKVYPSACEGTPSRDSVTLAATFAQAAGYPTDAEFDAYTINGDMVNWLASMDIPAISVLLTDRTNTELRQNQAGVEAVLDYVAAN